MAKRKAGRERTLDVFRGPHTLSRAPRAHRVRKPPTVGEQKTSEKTRPGPEAAPDASDQTGKTDNSRALGRRARKSSPQPWGRTA